MKRRITALCVGLGMLCAETRPLQADLVINMNYTAFTNSAPGNASTILNGASIAQAIAVMDRAKATWEAAFANSNSSASWATAGRITQTINVTWGAQSGSTLATGGTGWNPGNGAFTGGTLTWDNDGSSDFYVDPVPSNSSEWALSSLRSSTITGVSINVERVSYNAAATLVRDNSDMYTVALHEIGHALGYISSYPGFITADIGSDSDLDITGGPFAGAQLPVSGGHSTITLNTPGTNFPYDPGGGSFFPITTYGPTTMNSALTTGVRQDLSAADIASLGQILSFNLSTVNYAPVAIPEPSTYALVAATSGVWWLRRRRAVAS